MKALSRCPILLALLLLPLALSAGTGNHAQQFQRVGIVPLRDEGNVRNGAERLTSMLRARLAERYEDIEFFVVELDKEDLPAGPLLLKEATEVCSETGADALIDGVFGGVEVVGGTWPNKGGDHPAARGFLHWRLVEGAGGMLVTDGNIEPDKPEIYSQRIRTMKQLQTRVMQDLADAVVAALEDCPQIAGDTGEGT